MAVAHMPDPPLDARINFRKGTESGSITSTHTAEALSEGEEVTSLELTPVRRDMPPEKWEPRSNWYHLGTAFVQGQP